jgi:apurinic endonuclease APN1
MNILLSRFNYEIGTHVSFHKTLVKTMEYSISLGMYTFQFFLGSPQSFTISILSDEDIAQFHVIKKRFPTKVFVHSPYVFNLAGSKDCLSWNGDSLQDEKTIKVIKSLEKELNHVALFGQGVVLHPGCFTDKKKGCKAIAKSINMIDFHPDSKLILENMAGQGSVIGSMIEELKDIKDQVVPEKQKYIGFCIDTAHIWGKGLYDLREIKEIDKMFYDLENILGIQYITLFHLNDSKVLFASNVDRHELLGEGEIWKDHKNTLHYLLEKLKFYNIPCVMETDPSDMLKFLD